MVLVKEINKSFYLVLSYFTIPPTSNLENPTYSIITSNAIASTIGTALGTTHGSCLPLAANVPGVPSYVAVCCGNEIVAGGLKATLKYIFSPLLMPPCIPPELFVVVPREPSARRT